MKNKNIYIGIGASYSQLAPAYLLKHTIKKFNINSNYNFIVTNIFTEIESKLLLEKKDYSLGTVFSLQRFLVASIAERYDCSVAIYIDSDMVCLKSFEDLISDFIKSKADIFIPDKNKKFNQKIQTAFFVTKINKKLIKFYAQLLNNFFFNKISYIELISNFYKNINYQLIGFEYNSRNYSDDSTVFLHYTDLWSQPWVCPYRKESAIWMQTHFYLLNSDSFYFQLIHDGVLDGSYRRCLINNYFLNVFLDIFFLPPQFKVYFDRNKISAYFPNFLKGFLVQMIGLIRSIINLRIT